MKSRRVTNGMIAMVMMVVVVVMMMTMQGVAGAMSEDDELYQLAEEVKEYSTDLYSFLGVTQQATKEQIRKAYNKQSKLKHPDRNKNNPNAEEEFRKLNRAKAILSNPDSREKYDYLLAYGGRVADERDMRFPFEFASKFMGAPTHNTWNVLIYAALALSVVHYAMMNYRFNQAMQAAKETPQYKRLVREKKAKMEAELNGYDSGYGSGTGKSSPKKRRKAANYGKKPVANKKKKKTVKEEDIELEFELANVHPPRIVDVLAIQIILFPINLVLGLTTGKKLFDRSAEEAEKMKGAIKIAEKSGPMFDEHMVEE